jgi:hypothetical protein
MVEIAAIPLHSEPSVMTVPGCPVRPERAQAGNLLAGRPDPGDSTLPARDGLVSRRQGDLTAAGDCSSDGLSGVTRRVFLC